MTIHYKEIELYVSWKDIDEFNSDKCGKLIERLNKNNAIISAIHCPESLYETSNDECYSPSSNYLSICEAIKDEDSQAKLKRMIEFSEDIYRMQWGINRDESKIDMDDEDIVYEKSKHDKIFLVVHSGCEIGCQEIVGKKHVIVTYLKIVWMRPLKVFLKMNMCKL